ncbi:MAG: histidine phosphatase family protein [Patescibacteria group bacterium]|nr:histidine phosphatase family protein [Patescibacteria group bacterium]MDD5294990.1 histidine phosphatase family protein [Patescibacteria group bacterium]MDD5554544.1 histidine phosphatase family protein [Patescibacteria group bacterium]
MIKITYFVHGTTTDNEKNLSTGWQPGELSELGIKQAKELGNLVSKKFDAFFCSDLKRAVDSANLGFGNKYKIIQDKRLRECNYGNFNGGTEEKIDYKKYIDMPFPNGESLKDVEKRIRDFLNFLKEGYNNKHIAIMAHKAPQLALEVILNNKTWEQAIKKDWRNTKSWQPGWEYEIK